MSKSAAGQPAALPERDQMTEIPPSIINRFLRTSAAALRLGAGATEASVSERELRALMLAGSTKKRFALAPEGQIGRQLRIADAGQTAATRIRASRSDNSGYP